jgi:hypothetical protein
MHVSTEISLRPAAFNPFHNSSLCSLAPSPGSPLPKPKTLAAAASSYRHSFSRGSISHVRRPPPRGASQASCRLGPGGRGVAAAAACAGGRGPAPAYPGRRGHVVPFVSRVARVPGNGARRRRGAPAVRGRRGAVLRGEEADGRCRG